MIFRRLFSTTRAPRHVALDPDDYLASHVGWTADQRQVLLTEPFVPPTNGQEGADYLALYIFDKGGALENSYIVCLGPRGNCEALEYGRLRKELIDFAGPIEPRRIQFAPFSFEHNGVEFGMIARAPEDEDEEWAVEAHPGNYMAFFEPWDSGEYDT